MIRGEQQLSSEWVAKKWS